MKLAYINNNQVIDILEPNDPRINTLTKFQNNLVSISNDFQEGDYIFNGVKIQPKPSSNHELNDQGEWYLPEDIANEIQLEEARILLKSTDWMIIREMDTGVLTPVEIKQQRQAARELISQLTEQE